MTAGDDAEIVKGGSFIGDVGAVQIKKEAVVAAPEKVQSILKNLGIQKGAKKPKEGGYRCMPRYQMDFFEPNGDLLATAGLLCGGDEDGPAQGTLQFKGKSYLIDAKDVGDINDLAKAPAAVGDMAWRTDKIVITRPGDSSFKATLSEAADVTKALSSMDGNEVPKWDAAIPKCLPAQAATFYRGKSELFSVAMGCGAGAEGKVMGVVRAGAAGPKDKVGTIGIDASVISKLAKAVE